MPETPILDWIAYSKWALVPAAVVLFGWPLYLSYVAYLLLQVAR